jgi:hypothetical protein
MAGEHAVDAAGEFPGAIPQAGHRRSQIDAAAAGDCAALRVAHQLGRFHEPPHLVGVLGSGNVERPVDP